MAIYAVSLIPAIKTKNLAFSAWATGMNGVFHAADYDEMVCEYIESAVENNINGFDNFDTEKFLDENCGGVLGNCDDPLLSMDYDCGIFEACPHSPLECNNYIAGCLNQMLNFKEGFTATELIIATDYLLSGMQQGTWEHKSLETPPIWETVIF